MAKFKVDTKLFRELGELLVGRDSTALVELIKNSYDADATRVRIHGTDLDSLSGSIIVEDDGIGMDAADFERGFLTIAGRTKIGGNKRSRLYQRRFTGEKGVGRLAAHKLARTLEVHSRKFSDEKRDPLLGLPSKIGVSAKIDWDRVEALEDLDKVATSDAVVVKDLKASGQAGTKLSLIELRKPWTGRDLGQFYDEVATLTPPEVLSSPLPERVTPKPLLFDRPKVRDNQRGDPGFSIKFSGSFTDVEQFVPSVAESAAWIIEIECRGKDREIEIAVEPTGLFKTEFANAEGFRTVGRIPDFDPFERRIEPIDFTARIFEKEQVAWTRAFRGVRVYLEGFRVLPYGDGEDDWLGLAQDYRSRGRGEMQRLRRFSDWEKPDFIDDREGLVIKGNGHYFGAVFLTRDGADCLKILANREGFLPSPTWDFVSDSIRHAIGIQVRTRQAATSQAKIARTFDRAKRQDVAARSSEYNSPTVFRSHELHRRASDAVREAKSLVAAGRSKEANDRLTESLSVIELAVTEAMSLSSEGASETVMYRVLASLGLEQAAFVHEILGLGSTADTIARGLDAAAKTKTIPSTEREKLRSLAAEARSLRERLKRNGVYLADMTGVEGRRRRSRILLRDRFNPVVEFFRSAAASRKIEIINEIPEDLTSPPVFPAEISALFSNLVSNAVKFAGSPGKVRASGRNDKAEVIIRIENTGTSVDLNSADRWFEPFRSTTHEVDHVLGRGMGLGLTVSRSLMDEYGGEIAFVMPSNGYATAVELKWPRK
ncbi:sensor histidine kinase [Microvirga sp. CF3016]|uniref:sensor histidine kinase n=1 Tax=Microvirga sp. CF3016 TaxID=3110181 RepID=UPI002E776DF8|nr:sensor histidine kinase [Microvirga sp. CF3016]MEE1611870.1 sensor histidine kinase [Microvirga sp. CF3016]